MLIDKKSLIGKAVLAAKNAYSPYSNYSVGAALITKDGKIFTGCNIENSSFSATVCAERTAFFNAVSQGIREFAAIAVVGGKNGDFDTPAFPCGVCRQVMSEFCDENFKIILKNGEKQEEYTLSDLLPNSFTL